MSRVNYVTIDSILSGVGASQVAPYVSRLADLGHRMTLLSYEHRDSLGVQDELGFAWESREFGSGRFAPYRRILQAKRFLDQRPADIVHARSDLPALAALLSSRSPFIWDMRAFWREQRIELEAIKSGSPTDRFLIALERRLAHGAANIICLSDSAREVLVSRYGGQVADKTTVIPTLVDTEIFTPLRSWPEEERPLLLLSGTYNGFYDTEAIARIVEVFGEHREHEVLWAGGSEHSPLWQRIKSRHRLAVQDVPFSEMPELVRRSVFGLAVCKSRNPAPLAAAVPTKIAEFLACGRPVFVNAGLGDMDRMIREYRCGVILGGADPDSITQAVEEMLELLDDPEMPNRARRCALQEFDLATGIAKISEMYQAVPHAVDS